MDEHEKRVLVDRIIDCLELKNRGIDGETYAYLFDMIADEIADVSASNVSKALEDFRKYVRDTWEYDHVNELEGFDIGACWGAIRLLETYSSLTSETAQMQTLMAVIRRYEIILTAISENDGITQAELAEKVGVSRPNLSQTLARIRPYQLILTTVEGRNKHYSLTSRCSQLLDEMRPKHRWDNSGKGNTGGFSFSYLEANRINGTVDNAGRLVSAHGQKVSYMVFTQHMDATEGADVVLDLSARQKSLGSSSHVNQFYRAGVAGARALSDGAVCAHTG